MNRAVKVFGFVALVLLAIGCQKTPAPPAATTAQADVADAKSGFVILAGLGLADITDGNVKYVDSITLGEKLALTGQTKKITSGGREVDWLEVRRDSGKTGWARKDYVISSSILGVVTSDDAVIYDEPKNTSATAKSIPKLTILAVHSDSAGQSFLKVTLVDPATKYLTSDVYMKNDAISTKVDDVQSAILLQLAAASDKPTQKQALLQSAAKDYPSSLFVTQVQDAIAALNAPAPTKATEKFLASMTAMNDAVNVRNAPDEQTGNVVGTLSKGQKVQVQEKTVESFTVGGQTAPWYRIKDPAGWVFGTFLSAEQ